MVHLHKSSKIMSQKKVRNSINQVFLTFMLVDGRIRTNNEDPDLGGGGGK
jgi:hypothetical protein